MIQDDFADLHNHTSEALTAAWKLLWSLVITMLHGFCIAAIWMRNLVEPDASPAWVRLAFYEPVKLKYEPASPVATWLHIEGMNELQSESILCDQENHA